MRLILVFVGLAVALLIPFVLWGQHLEVSPEGVAAWLRGYGVWAWAVGIALLAADLFLPVPASAVLAALGFLYGPWVGGALGAVGSVGSGLLGFGLGRLFRRETAERWVGRAELEQGQRLFNRFGPWLIVLSRWLPLFPEVVSCAAGLIRMRLGAFLLALVCGSVPMSFTYAWVGHAGNEHPGWATGLSLLGPPLLWWLIGRRLLAKRPQAKLRAES